MSEDQFKEDRREWMYLAVGFTLLAAAIAAKVMSDESDLPPEPLPQERQAPASPAP